MPAVLTKHDNLAGTLRVPAIRYFRNHTMKKHPDNSGCSFFLPHALATEGRAQARCDCRVFGSHVFKCLHKEPRLPFVH